MVVCITREGAKKIKIVKKGILSLGGCVGIDKKRPGFSAKKIGFCGHIQNTLEIVALRQQLR